MNYMAILQLGCFSILVSGRSFEESTQMPTGRSLPGNAEDSSPVWCWRAQGFYEGTCVMELGLALYRKRADLQDYCVNSDTLNNCTIAMWHDRRIRIMLHWLHLTCMLSNVIVILQILSYTCCVYTMRWRLQYSDWLVTMLSITLYTVL